MTQMIDFSKDNKIKFAYDKQVHKFNFKRNVVGSELAEIILLKDYIDTDINTIYVSDIIGLDVNTGTKASPKKTIVAGANSCTILKTKVIVLDSILYNEDFTLIINSYFKGLYAETTQTPKRELRQYDFALTDANSIFVSKLGNDTTGTGTQINPYFTINKALTICDATHWNVVIDDSGEYNEDAFSSTAVFRRLFANKNCSPTLTFNQTSATSTYNFKYIKQQCFKDLTITYNDVITLNNNNFMVCYHDSFVGKFKIYDEAGILVIDETIFSPSVAYNISAVTFNNNNFMICYTDLSDSSKGKFVIYNENGTLSNFKTFTNNQTVSISATLLNNGDVVICYRDDTDSGKGKFIIYDEDGSIVKTVTVFSNNLVNYIADTVLNNNNFVILYSDMTDSNKGKFVIYNEAGANVLAPVTFSNNNVAFISAVTLHNNNFMVCYSDVTDSNKGKFVIYNEAGANVLAPVTFSNVSTTYIDLVVLNNSDIIICFRENSVNDYGFQIIYDQTGSLVKAKILFTSYVAYISIAILNNGNIIICNQKYNLNEGMFTLLYPYSWSAIIADSSFEIKGFILDAENQAQISEIIKNNVILNITNCNLKNGMGNENYNTYIIYGYRSIVKNCIFEKIDRGIYINSTGGKVENSIFHKIEKDYCIVICGASTNIEIEHNTIFDNYGALNFLDNAGSEIVKNNILYDNYNGSIAKINITETNSIDNGENTGIIKGAFVLSQDPFFINDGSVNPLHINLMLQNQLLGNKFTSVAYELGDDGLDAGAYNIIIIGDDPTYTEITVPKDTIVPGLKSVKPIRKITEDGSISASKKSQILILSFEWKGLTRKYADELENMFCTLDPEVKIFLNPIAEPSIFQLFIIDYSTNFDESVPVYTMSDLGVSNLKITFSKKYERV